MRYWILLSTFLLASSGFAQSWSDAPGGLGSGFEALRQRVEMEHAQRAGFQNVPMIAPVAGDVDVLKACPEIDAEYFARLPLAQAVASVQACVNRVYGSFFSDSFAIQASAEAFADGGCPQDRGLLHCASLNERPGIRIAVRGRSAQASRAASELRYSINVERRGRLEDWNVSIEEVR